MADRCVSRRFSKNWQSLALIGGLGAQVNPGPRSAEVPEASIWCLTRDHEAARDHFPGPAASPMSNEQLSGQVGRMSQVSHHASQAGAWLKRFWPLFLLVGACAFVFAMGWQRHLTLEELAELRKQVGELKGHELDQRYETALTWCRIHRHPPSPRQMQELVQLWRELRRRYNRGYPWR